MIPGATGGGEAEVFAPYDGQPIARVATADCGAIETALATAASVFAERDRWLPPARWIEILERAAGARVLSGGTRISDTCYAPTVLYDPPDDVRVSTQEVFGPVVCVYPYDDLDHAIGRANALPYAFQAAMFTRDINLALRAYARLDASAVMVNDHTAFRVDWMPFAGLKQSGHGVGGIAPTLHDMQIEKMLVVRSPEL